MSLIAELKRRNVFRVAAAYLVAGWLIVEIGSALAEIYGAPAWVLKMLVGILSIGFPVALLFSWAYELTPEGLKRDKDVVSQGSSANITAKRLDGITIGLILLVGAFVLLDRTWLSTGDPVASAKSASEPTAPPSSAPDLSAPENSIAVLAFTNMSSDQGQAYFADGLSDTLIHVLAQVSGLRVTAKTSSFYFKGKDVTIAEIADKLEVAHVLEGSVQKAGNKIRVIVQLIKASDDSHIWSRNFDRDLADIFAVQDEIAQEVVKALRISLLDPEQDRLAQRYQPTLESYGALILGRQEMARRTAVSLAAAEQHFKQAIESDPDYALAYVGLSDTYNLQQEYSGLEAAESLAYQQPLIEKALELDPGLGEAYTSRAQIHGDLQDLEAAEADFLKSIELSPNYATARHWYSVLLFRQGRREESLAQVQMAVELDPMSSVIQTGLIWGIWGTGRVEEALTLSRKNIMQNPEFPNHYDDMGRMMSKLGRLGEAQLWVGEARKLNPKHPGYWQRSCVGLLELGDDLSAEACLNRLGEVHPKFHRSGRGALLYYRKEWDVFVSHMQALWEQQPGNHFLVAKLAEELARRGETKRALGLMSETFPEFLGEEVELHHRNLEFAAPMAAILDANGKIEQRDVVLQAIEARIATLHRTRGNGYGIQDVFVHAIRGDRDQAITGLREAFDVGWRQNWWMLRSDWKLADLQQDPDFVALVNEFEADAVKQYQWYEENKGKPLL